MNIFHKTGSDNVDSEGGWDSQERKRKLIMKQELEIWQIICAC